MCATRDKHEKGNLCGRQRREPKPKSTPCTIAANPSQGSRVPTEEEIGYNEMLAQRASTVVELDLDNLYSWPNDNGPTATQASCLPHSPKMSPANASRCSRQSGLPIRPHIRGIQSRYNKNNNNHNNCRRLLLCLLAISMSAPANARPQSSCILCDNEDRRAKDALNVKNYEEFLFEHQVSTQEAIRALRSFNNSFVEDNSCAAINCNDNVMKYCLGPQFLNDHCWCELGHPEEGLPYVPHICYVGEKIHRPATGSCFLYEEYKECCCAAALTKKWRHISGVASNQLNMRSLKATLVFVVSIMLLSSLQIYS